LLPRLATRYREIAEAEALAAWRKLIGLSFAALRCCTIR
jgi:hypothetical protein